MRYRLMFVLFILFCVTLRADEGMWLFDAAPKKQIKEKYEFEPTDDWLKHVQLSSVRFGRSGSAAFVSSKGLVMTNHHVGARQLQALSTPERDLLTNGFYAKTHAEELKCAGLEFNVLISTEDVTEKVNAAVTPEMPPEDSQKARQTVMAELEKQSKEATGLKSDVMTFYQGGAYHLYRYKVYDDIRLVWAPENAIGSFGGDPDNYEFPRYCLDVAFFRAYENGEPAKIEHFLKWSANGAKDGELVFVSGHPGRTDRALTREHLEFQRDVFFPWRLQKLFRREVTYSTYAERSEENARRIRNDLDAVKNYRKRAIGQLQGLQTPSLWGGKISAEGKDKDSPEAIIAAACKAARSTYVKYDLWESAEAFNSRTFQIARTLVRLAHESEKPDSERLKEYRDSNLESLKRTLLADTPIHEDVEILKLTDSLSMLEMFSSSGFELHERDGHGGGTVTRLSPKELATKLILNSNIRDVAERKRLIEEGIRAIDTSGCSIGCSMIQFALTHDSMARKARKAYEEQVEAPLEKAYAEIAQRRFAEFGTDIYPDATFTLRLSYGVVKSYEEDGNFIEPMTNIAGMYERAELQKFRPPYDPPQRWKTGREKLDPAVPFNLVTTNDIIGGNSGSPLINRNGEVVGVVFDGNIHSLSNNFIYSDKQSRCVSVHSAVVVEALRKLYDANELADELGR